MSLRGKSSSYTKQADTQHYSSWFLILTFKITGRDLQRQRPQAVHFVWSSCLQEPHTLDKLDVWNTLQSTEWGPGSQRLPAFPRLTTQPSSKSPCLTSWQQRRKEKQKTAFRPKLQLNCWGFFSLKQHQVGQIKIFRPSGEIPYFCYKKCTCELKQSTFFSFSYIW